MIGMIFIEVMNVTSYAGHRVVLMTKDLGHFWCWQCDTAAKGSIPVPRRFRRKIKGSYGIVLLAS